MVQTLISSADWSSCSEVFCKKGVLNILAKFTRKHLCWRVFLIKLQAWSLQLYLKETLAQVFCWEFCEIFKNTYLVESMRTATFGLINSCETSIWLLYTYNHIFCWLLRSFWLSLSPPLPVSLYPFDFKFHIQGYILIKSVSCSFSTEVISSMLNACCHLLLLLLLLLLMFQSPYKSGIFLNKLVFKRLH